MAFEITVINLQCGRYVWIWKYLRVVVVVEGAVLNVQLTRCIGQFVE
jgi:hypothetical protein